MLVRVWKSLVLEGTTTVEKGIIRKRLVKEKMYVSRGIETKEISFVFLSNTASIRVSVLVPSLSVAIIKNDVFCGRRKK